MKTIRRMIAKLASRARGLNPQSGFSIIEVLVGSVVLVVGLVFIAQFFTSAMARVLDSDIRSVLHQVATKELESIRGLPYEDVGTVGGWPTGALEDVEYRDVENVTVQITRKIIFWSDDAYDGPIPAANYRRVTVSVEAGELDGADWTRRSGVDAVELTSNVAGGAEGATLLVHVLDMAGTPVSGAKIKITNTHLIPHINISSYETNYQGDLLVPGLDPDSSGYYLVEASKLGYSSDSWSDGPLVESSLQEITLRIDRLASMVVRLEDSDGDPVMGGYFTVTGPESYVNSKDDLQDEEWRIDDLRFSESSDPYVVTLLADAEGQYESEAKEVVLLPDTTQEVVFIVDAEEPTTTTESTTTTTDPTTPTTEPTSTTTTSSSTTSTTLGLASLRVTVNGWRYVHGHGGGWQYGPLQGASVSIGAGAPSTNKDGIVFFGDLAPGDYTLTVHATQHWDYSATVSISGATDVTVNLSWKGW